MENKNKFQKLTNPSLILQKLEIPAGAKVADFGCGSGYYTLSLAKLVGGEGKIWAIDILESSLEAVKSKVETEGFLNIETVRADLEAEKGSGLKDKSMDFILMSNILFQVEDRKAILKEAERVLKKNGRIAVIEWRPDVKSMPLGPNDKIDFDKETVKKEAKGQGLKFEKEFEVDDYHYGLLFQK